MICWLWKQKETINEYIYNASKSCMINHSLRGKYNKMLELGNIVIVDCGLEKFCETRGTKCNKVVFKICGISYISKGVPPRNELAMLGSSPSQKRLCKWYRIKCWLLDFKRLCHLKNCFVFGTYTEILNHSPCWRWPMVAELCIYIMLYGAVQVIAKHREHSSSEE